MAKPRPEAWGSAHESASPVRPRQAIILAAGRGARLSPYTDTLPTALVPVGGRAILAQTISALRSQGVSKFIVCRGWMGHAFDGYLGELGDGVLLVDCPHYQNTGMVESLKTASSHLNDESYYIVYGDIVFRPAVARQLAEASGDIVAVVNGAAPGHVSKDNADVEFVVTVNQGVNRSIRKVGKNRCGKKEEVAGEFAGLVKVTSFGKRAVESTLDRLCSWRNAKDIQEVPWWLEPIEMASVSDLLQLLIDIGTSIVPALIFGGWHEVNTPADLSRARNDTQLFLSEESTKAQVAAMGACMLSEANDLKRPLNVVAKELNVSLAKLENLLRGDLEVDEALDVLRKMSEVYPIPLNDLWLDTDDTDGGALYCSREAGEASSRILDRLDRTGKRTPYYEYRDAAMSRCSQFRPEWIKELRLVQSGDPLDPDVQLNKGHLMMQTTLFVGPVDFYYTDREGRVHREEMNTGDSNFISPFVPHSFTVREPGAHGLIIAVTYGGSVRRAFTEFARVGAESVFSLAGDKRDASLTRRCVLQRHLEAECMTSETLIRNVGSAINETRVQELVEGAQATANELEVLASALSVKPSDLQVYAMNQSEEVVVTKSVESQRQARLLKTYSMTPLARTRHQPDLKTFDVEVLDTATPGEVLKCGLHTFAYHFGSEPVLFCWAGKTQLFRPGDSVYVRPLVEHSFSVCPEGQRTDSGANPNGGYCGQGRRIFIVRIPGQLTGETLNEFATFSASGRNRVGAETTQWYS
eukprot:TRINITY_DN4070_c0_g2_i1.p1 TRINITY_DN4070_c0_g2~~TRINITY_DN4070_c0_g2_i1.p1  ORF type:complete len:779 (+),score=93.76 TRINITY_DN4070_c0_g2_i1:77-2338(+)